MGRNAIITLVLLTVMALWTLLAWGTSALLTWLPELASIAENGTTQLAPQLREGVLLVVPQAVLDTWLPWLLQLWNWLMASFPTLISWAGYIVWIIWGLGIVALLLLTVVARSLLNKWPTL